MLLKSRPLSRHRNVASKRFARRPSVEGLEMRLLMATGFPMGFVGPLTADAYYDSSLAKAGDSQPALVGPGLAPSTFYSNYDAPTLTDIINTAPQPPDPPAGTITFTTSAGQFDELVADQDGITSTLTSTVTIPSSITDVQSQTDNVLLIIPPNYQGHITVHETWTLPTPGSQDITVAIARYDDGSYEATLQDLKTLGSLPAAPAPQAPGSLQGQTGVRDGIDWSTLKSIGAGFGDSPDPDTGKMYRTTGTVWTVKTVKGSTLTLLEADPIAQQPAATRAIPTYKDPTYNCHGYTFGATGVVCPDGKTRSFEFTQNKDVTTILRGIVKFRGWRKSGGVGLIDAVHEDGSGDHLRDSSRSVQRSPRP